MKENQEIKFEKEKVAVMQKISNAQKMDIQVFDENGKALHITDVIRRLKFELEVNASMLAEPLLNQGKQPKDDENCHKAFLVLAHLESIEDYINGL
jgi:hypothetical protein